MKSTYAFYHEMDKLVCLGIIKQYNTYKNHIELLFYMVFVLKSQELLLLRFKHKFRLGDQLVQKSLSIEHYIRRQVYVKRKYRFDISAYKGALPEITEATTDNVFLRPKPLFIVLAYINFCIVEDILDVGQRLS